MTHGFKVGDKAKYKIECVFETKTPKVTIEMDAIVLSVKDNHIHIETTDFFTGFQRYYSLNDNEIINCLTKVTPEESLVVEPKFKVGDFVKIKNGIVPLMKNIVDIWEIKELFLSSNSVRLKASSYEVIVFLNEITLAE